MGFDNECNLNIQSLPGEYFCPVCRTVIYFNEAMQTQCTHFYCKPCLTYVAATTQACPYDGYLVSEADSKYNVCITRVVASGKEIYLNPSHMVLLPPMGTPLLFVTTVVLRLYIVKCMTMLSFVL
ncbi:hypothetical protein QYE76_014953 [Lolium multiflorum]|uniref:RING-type domain-containing protein n=1 Tax=Lolium multiflorum TaxID=4521 RepID=A0AAD8U1N7_LOLMU|nr:hypothetical protein QYE76_014953 [Lolium multiflorum]